MFLKKNHNALYKVIKNTRLPRKPLFCSERNNFYRRMVRIVYYTPRYLMVNTYTLYCIKYDCFKFSERKKNDVNNRSTELLETYLPTYIHWHRFDKSNNVIIIYVYRVVSTIDYMDVQLYSYWYEKGMMMKKKKT